MAELEHLGGKRAESARVRRAEQLRRWRSSQTQQEPAERQPRTRRGGPRVRFEDGAVFLAACSSGDTDEVKRLLARGADINTTNVDGLTALHQVTLAVPAGEPATPRRRGCGVASCARLASAGPQGPYLPGRCLDFPAPAGVVMVTGGLVRACPCRLTALTRLVRVPGLRVPACGAVPAVRRPFRHLPFLCGAAFSTLRSRKE